MIVFLRTHLEFYKYLCELNFILFSAPDHLRFLQHSTIPPKKYRHFDQLKFAKTVSNEAWSGDKSVQHKNYDEEESDGMDQFDEKLSPSDNRLPIKIYAKPRIIQKSFDLHGYKVNKHVYDPSED